MARCTIFALLLLAVVVVATYAKPHTEVCSFNEVYDVCGSDCEPSCEVPFPIVCTLKCNIGCRCQDGYLKKSDGSCVLPSEC